MSRPATATKAQMKRAIEAAREAGMRVWGIKPDGTLLLEEQGNSRPTDNAREVQIS